MDQFPPVTSEGLSSGIVWFLSMQFQNVKHGGYLEGQGDLVSRLITPITHIVTLIIPIINLLTKSP